MAKMLMAWVLAGVIALAGGAPQTPKVPLGPDAASQDMSDLWRCALSELPATYGGGVSYGDVWFFDIGDDQFRLQGMLGWHVTWAINIDASTQPWVIEDTLHPSGSDSRPLFRTDAPPELRRAFQSCGALWRVPSPPQARPLPQLPADLLPPKP